MIWLFFLKSYGENILVYLISLTSRNIVSKSNTKISAHDWIIWVNSEYIVTMLLLPILNMMKVFSNVFNTKIVEIGNMARYHQHTKQSNECQFSIVMKIYYICPILNFNLQIIMWIDTIKFGVISIILLYFKVSQRMRLH